MQWRETALTVAGVTVPIYARTVAGDIREAQAPADLASGLEPADLADQHCDIDGRRYHIVRAAWLYGRREMIAVELTPPAEQQGKGKHDADKQRVRTAKGRTNPDD